MSQHISINRRNLLAATGGVAAASLGAGTFSGCGAKNAPGKSGGSGGGATGGAVLPTYKEAAAPTPDKPAKDWVEALYMKYPTELTQSVAEKPGKGSTFSAITPYWTPNPSPKDSAYTKAVDEALGATIDHKPISAADYDTKLTAMIASGKDLPDTLACYGWAFPPKMAQALEPNFVNLSEVLGGDKAADYPNLANIPSLSWKNGIFNNALWAVPVPSAAIQVAPFYRQDMWEAAGIKEVKNKDEFLAMCQELTKPGEKQYALGSRLFNTIGRFMYGLNYDWEIGSDGKFTIAYEDPAYPDALELMAKVAKSYVHPDLLSETGDQGALFKAGKVTLINDGADAWSGMGDTKDMDGKSAGYHCNGWVPCGPDGKDPRWVAAPAALLSVFINKRNTGDKLKELLGVMNLLAAPFGTKEWELLHFGVEGTHFGRANGAPDKRSEQIGDDLYGFMASPARVLNGYQSGQERAAEERYAWMEKMAPRVVESKSGVLHVELPTALQAWKKPMDDLESAIIKGQKPLSDFAPALADWKSKFGDKVRAEYEKAWEANTVGK